ncbi:MAG: FAD-binding oxidoreductase [Saprospiraceae bacterium]|nr:FAD-binding oxidoreductase [Saprospiraceae bacterium]
MDHKLLEVSLGNILPEDRIKTRLIDRYAYASDASHFYLLPRAVVQPVTVEEVRDLFRLSQQLNIPMTFRAAGTSLSGQGLSEGILADLSNFWRKVTPGPDGQTVRVEPGAIGAHVNRALQPFGRKIGPDPASINTAMMGGILSNNSSGMCCGVLNNSYHTLKSLTFLLPNGNLYDTGSESDHQRFIEEDKTIAEGLIRLRQEILDQPNLVARIRQKYQQKNTVGYGLNAFLDYEHPLDILAHVLIGGEGTLAFIAEAVLNTIHDLPHKLTGMLYFDHPATACASIPALKTTGAEALEFMDRASLRSVEHMPGVPAFLKDLPENASAILCEFQQSTPAALEMQYDAAGPVFAGLPLIMPPQFTRDPEEQALLWKIRKGMYPSVAGMRAKGTSALLEDITFPVERLGDAVIDIQALFKKHGYRQGIIFGHAKDGNLHFVVSQSFATDKDIADYERFNDDLFHMVLQKYDGSLKGEHSSGRAVSAYIPKEWGPEAYRIMQELKALIDPHRLLNPGIVVTEDPLTHIHHLKVMPVVDPEVDRCIECGFCENVCPSRDITLTPRRRIGIRRAIKRLEIAGDHAAQSELLKAYQYDGLDTCAVDGLCATQCPVDINTGDLVKKLRAENHSHRQNRLASWLANHFKLLESGARFAIRSGQRLNRLFGHNSMEKTTRALRRLRIPVPQWNNSLNGITPGSRRTLESVGNISGAGPEVIYYSSCITRMMDGELPGLVASLGRKAQVGVRFMNASGSCCGQIFSSKGFVPAFRETVNQTIPRLFEESRQGELPIVLDVTSCTQTLRNCGEYLTEANREKYNRLLLLDVIDFATDYLMPRLSIDHPKDRIVLHPVCSAYKLGVVSKLNALGKACARDCIIPTFAGCCGMAGDRGFLIPELTDAATRREATEVKANEYSGYYSTSKTCELAMTEAVGKNYQSILKLLDEVSSDS